MIVKESPLQGMNLGTIATVAIRELPGLNTIDLRVAPGSLTQAEIANILGIELPARCGQGSKTPESGVDTPYALCLAPDWWLIVGLQEAEELRSTSRSKSNDHFSIVDVSGQRTTIELEGPKVSELLAHLWDQDLREKNFPVASVSQGLMAKAPVIVWHIDSFRYRIMVRSSFALHLWNALADAMAEWV